MCKLETFGNKVEFNVNNKIADQPNQVRYNRNKILHIWLLYQVNRTSIDSIHHIEEITGFTKENYPREFSRLSVWFKIDLPKLNTASKSYSHRYNNEVCGLPTFWTVWDNSEEFGAFRPFS